MLSKFREKAKSVPQRKSFILNFPSRCLISLQEQSVNDETDVQLMATHTASLLDTLRDIAQVSHDPHAPHVTRSTRSSCLRSFVRRFYRKEIPRPRQIRKILAPLCWRCSTARPHAGPPPRLGPGHSLSSPTRLCPPFAQQSPTKPSSCR